MAKYGEKYESDSGGDPLGLDQVSGCARYGDLPWRGRGGLFTAFQSRSGRASEGRARFERPIPTRDSSGCAEARGRWRLTDGMNSVHYLH